MRSSLSPERRRLVRGVLRGARLASWLAALATTMTVSALDANAPSKTNEHSFSQAQHRAPGFYLGAGFTMVYAPDETFTIDSAGSAASTSNGDNTLWLDYDLGFRAASFSAGYAFPSGVRAELEAGYRRNELEVLSYSDTRGTLNTGGSDAVDTFTGFANLYYDFKPNLAVQPYLGAGIGLANTTYKTSFTTLDGFERVETALLRDSDTTLAWQLIAGASIPFTPRTRLSAEYRYWQTTNLNLTDLAGDAYRSRHKLHMATVGVQFFPNQRAGANTPTRRHSVKPASSGLYVAARFGALAAEDSDLDDKTNDFEDTNFDAFDIGPAGALAIGYAFDPQQFAWRGWPLRAELEASVFTNEADVVDFGKVPGEFRMDGKAKVKALSLNLLAERRRRAGITPYAGIGFGYAEVNYDVQVLGADRNGVAIPGAINTLVNDSDGSATVQGLLGVSVALRDGLQLSLGYRYWWAPILRVRDPDGLRLKTEHSAHALHLGLRFGPH